MEITGDAETGGLLAVISPGKVVGLSTLMPRLPVHNTKSREVQAPCNCLIPSLEFEIGSLHFLDQVHMTLRKL